jgi:CRP-like cAMP-binding protein
MDCSVMDGQAAAFWGDVFASTAVPVAEPPVNGSLCMTCPVRDACIGGVAAQAGTRQLLEVLAGRRTLRAGEAIEQSYPCICVVRAGSLKSQAPGENAGPARGFHFRGEAVGAAARGGMRLVALEESELCVMRAGVDGTPGTPGSGSRAYLGRLWDMVSRELLRERAQLNRLAALQPVRRITVLLAGLVARANGASSRALRLHLTAADIAGHLDVPLETVGRVLAVLVKREVLLHEPRHLAIANPEWLQAAADRD